jgi:hypothetical protein
MKYATTATTAHIHGPSSGRGSYSVASRVNKTAAPITKRAGKRQRVTAKLGVYPQDEQRRAEPHAIAICGKATPRRGGIVRWKRRLAA